MPKNILVDLNVILDVLLERPGFKSSRSVLQLGESANTQLSISAHIVTTFAYLLENAKVPKAQIKYHVDWMLQTFAVVPTTNEVLHAALDSKITDYEDAVIEQAAVKSNAKAIITRNTKDFKNSTVAAVSPETFLSTQNLTY